MPLCSIPGADTLASVNLPESTNQTRAPGGSSPWTTRSLLAWMSSAFREKDLDSPRLLAEMLLSHVIGCDRLRLYMEADRPASEDERTRLRSLVARALRHEPVQYLVGEAWFFSLPFHVDPRVLIPRPSTETIAEAVGQSMRGVEGPIRLADLCTGSGCLAVALAKHVASASIVATDISEDALEVARLNAARHGVSDRIEFRQGNLLEPLEHERDLHCLVANPPYIPDHEWESVEPNVRDHEPELALRAGPDGLDLLIPLLRGASRHLRPGGLLLLEIASCNAERMLDLARSQDDLCDEGILDDFEGLARVLRATRK